jgi:glycosyltransferase involved in cell wall biosynthesis
MRKPRLAYIVTHAMTARHLMSGQLAFMKGKGFEVFLIASPGEDLQPAAEREGVSTRAVTMHREISPYKDLISLIQLYRNLKELAPDIVNAGTPKAGFLGMIAARLARVRFRIYTLRGLRLETKKGLSRFLLMTTERIASVCAHRVVCVSESLRQVYVRLQLSPESKTIVLSSGSSNGVDASRFLQYEDSDRRKQEQRFLVRIPLSAPVIGFVGRLTRDKGVIDLLQIFEILVRKIPDLRLLIVGDFEKGDPVDDEAVDKIRNHPRIVFQGSVQDTAPYYTAMDLLAFPSYREGFPNVVLEAGACAIPAVGYAVTGTVDAIQDGVTGTLVRPRDIRGFADAVLNYLENNTLRIAHGQAARQRVCQHFLRESIWNAWYREYESFLNGRKL